MTRELGMAGLRRWGAIAAAVYLGIAQLLLAAHAASPQALAPDHNQSECAYCAAADPSGHGATPHAPSLPESVRVVAEVATPTDVLPALVVTGVPPARGPPSH